MMRASRVGVVVAIVTTALRDAAAQDAAAEAARRELISQAERASDTGEHARAVELLTRAAAVRYSPSLREALAEELLATRNWLRAYVEAVTCQREAAASEQLTDRRSILRDCARAEAQARPHLGHVVVLGPEGDATLRVTVAGTEIPRALWGVRYPVAAGASTVEATSGDGRRFREEVTIPEGQERAVTVTLSAPPPPPPPDAVPTQVPTQPEPASPPPPSHPIVPAPAAHATPLLTPHRRGPGVGPWVVAGSGGVIMASAAGFFALRESSVAARDEACNPARCDDAGAQRGISADGEARTWNLLTNVALGVGAAAVIGGAVWWFAARTTSRTTTAWVTPQPGGFAFGLSGRL